jgi:hypothetical protein
MRAFAWVRAKPIGICVIAFSWFLAAALGGIQVVGLAFDSPRPSDWDTQEISWFVVILIELLTLLLFIGLIAAATRIGWLLMRLQENGRYAAKIMAGVWAGWAFLLLTLLLIDFLDGSHYLDWFTLAFFGSILGFNLWSFFYLSRPSVMPRFEPNILPLSLHK